VSLARRDRAWRRTLVAVAGSVVAVATSAPITAAQSESPPRAVEPASPTGPAALGLKGFLLFKNYSHFRETPTDNRNFREEGVLQLEWARRPAPWADLRLVGEARADDDGFARGVTFQIPETAERRSVLSIREAVARLGQGPVEVFAGKQVFAWGTADAYNPTDTINPYDYMDVLDTEKMAVWSVAVRATVGATSLTFVVVPVFTPSRTPLVGGRWNPPPPPGVIVDDREVPGRDVDNMQYAARLRTTVRGLDLSVSYYDGFDDLPEIRLRGEPIAPGVVLPRVTPVFTRIKVPGADVSTTVGPFELHAEGAFRLVESNGRADRFQGIAGINYTWDATGLRWLQQVIVIAEYARETVLRTRRHSGIIDEPGIGPHAFRDAPVGRMTLKFTEETQVKLTALLDLTRAPSYYAQAKVVHKVTDALHVEAGLDFMAGDRDTFWGRFRDNDRFFFSAKYFF